MSEEAKKEKKKEKKEKKEKKDGTLKKKKSKDKSGDDAPPAAPAVAAAVTTTAPVAESSAAPLPVATVAVDDRQRLLSVHKMSDSLSLADFVPLRTIGTGSFGRVMVARYSTTGRYYALKLQKKSEIVRLKQVQHVKDEKAILSSISHPYIVNLLATFQDASRIVLVLEFVTGGEVFTFLRRARRFDNERAKLYTAQIVSAFDYLHARNIIYRDLKPENLLFAANGVIKVTDFGFAKVVPDKTYTVCVPAEHEILTERGFMDLDAYLDASAAAPIRVASYDATAKQLVFELPCRLVQFAHETRTLVELTDAHDNSKVASAANNNDVRMLVTLEHDLYIQQRGNADYAKVKAKHVLSDDKSFDAVRQIACAEAGVRHTSPAAALPFAAALKLDTAEKLAIFYKLYGYWLGDGSLTRSGAAARSLHFAPVKNGDIRWLCWAFEQLDIKSWSCPAEQIDGKRADIYVFDHAWVEFFAHEYAAATAKWFAAWVWTLDAPALREILAGLRFADGEEAVDRSVIWTSSARFRDEIVRVCLIAGYTAHFSREDSSWAVSYCAPESASSKKTCYPTLYKAQGEIGTREYTGRVWCFTMPSGLVWVRAAQKDADGVVTEASRALLTGNCGTPEYIAPEIIRSQGHSAGADWWALGILIYEMLVGYPPYFADNPFGIYEKILSAAPIPFPPTVDKDAKDLIKSLLQHDLTKRFGCMRNGADDIKTHKWFKGIDWIAIDNGTHAMPWTPPQEKEGEAANFDKYQEEKLKLDTGDDPYRKLFADF